MNGGAAARRRWFLVGAVVVVPAVALGFCVGQRGASVSGASGAGESAGESASALLAIGLPDAEGREQSLGQWRGKVLVVNFWATWCAPCREEMPEFVRAQAKLGSKGLQFVGIAVDEVDRVRQFGAEIGVNYPLLIGGFGAMDLSRAFGNKLMALPFTLVVTRDGVVAHRQLGPLREPQLSAVVGGLL